MKKKIFTLLAVLFVSGCSIYQISKFTEMYGVSNADNRDITPVEGAEIEYWSDIKPILDNRCVVCHSCYDAPCQLKLTAPEGLERGAIRKSPYDVRINPDKPSRLFQDGDTVNDWREFGFHPVLNEHDQSELANRHASSMYQLLEQKERVPLELNNQKLSDEYTLKISRKQYCPKIHELEKHIAENPSWGMPYALPGLPDQEQVQLKKWIEGGATYASSASRHSGFSEEINAWEAFFNSDDLKTQLMSRYVYEHLFLANIYFTENGTPTFFKLVRSVSAPGVPVEPIYTRRPYSDPKVDRVYYRLIPEKETIVAKTHMPYLLNQERMAKWESLFLKADYEVSSLPSYKTKIASNPFKSFEVIPVRSRYQFLLDEAQFTIMNFIKGPVCRGQVALNVIRDHFWVVFTDPSFVESEAVSDFLMKNSEEFELPATTESSYIPIADWLRYSEKQRKVLDAKSNVIKRYVEKDGKIDLGLIWDGDGNNENAALTVFRHHDNATVEKGFVGDAPKTAWVINYSLLERIHYLLVAGYDIYGNVGHQLLSRLYMDFLRIEGEANFLLFLPTDTRDDLRQDWYDGTPRSCNAFVSHDGFENTINPNISYLTKDPKQEFFALLQEKLKGVMSGRRDLAFDDKNIAKQLTRLSTFSGAYTASLPEVIYTRINMQDGSKHYVSLLRNTEHSNITSLFNEADQLRPEENTLTVAKGIVGVYPNAFLEVEQENIADLVDVILAIQTKEDFSAVMSKFGIRRTHPKFWEFSDVLHQAFLKENEIEYGVLDYNRLSND